MIDVPWRPGKSIGRTIYAQPAGSSYRDGEVVLGMVDSPELAAHICEIHNWWLEIKTEGAKAWKEFQAERGIEEES